MLCRLKLYPRLRRCNLSLAFTVYSNLAAFLLDFSYTIGRAEIFLWIKRDVQH